MKLTDIHLRDPFVLPCGNIYYLYGTKSIRQEGGFLQMSVYSSADLEDWTEHYAQIDLSDHFWADADFWAPDVFLYRGKYYMFLSCIGGGRKRGTHVFVSDTPTGTFMPVSPDPITPRDRQCLDATLYVEDGVPYLLYSWEWLEIGSGKIMICRLTDDLTARLDDGIELLDARNSGVSVEIEGCFRGKSVSGFVTDSPLLYKTKAGKYLLLWSTFGEKGYNIAIASSDSLYGAYQQEKLLFEDDGGHAMIFDTFQGERKISFHMPNTVPNERPQFYSVSERGNTLEL